ncbi:acyl-CoA reductase [Butyrivibrio sp. AD3002]|uniref:acyl-CoA reductase n=1 Tax=Butyrivibrio sp. AD3002 TaxID=1280670 RepID=UPI0003FE0C18|nr:acyl-CoA reductase [Butyrivibrio sp. AD3002]
MPQSFDFEKGISYLVGDALVVSGMGTVPALCPFDENVMAFLNDVSKELMADKAAKMFSDVITYAYWIRKASLNNLKERYDRDGMRIGRGFVFHIAPSNVAVNFAYSLTTSLLMGNSNVVRVPSKDFEQVEMITAAYRKVLERHDNIKPYIVCVRYERNEEINNAFSSMADVRIVWGGDQTIYELRKSPIPPRASEICFADRFSIAVIDSDFYMNIDNKKRVAEDFYNDTFLTDQNACTSPKLIVWMGSSVREAKELFWEEEYKLVKEKYRYQPIQGVNKLSSALGYAALTPGTKIEKHDDNLIIRVNVPEITDALKEGFDNSGLFYEYECDSIEEISGVCDDKKCQTLAYIGKSDVVKDLFKKGIKGIDRVVPVGKTMDFDLIWDGYDLPALLTRTITFS